MRAIIAAIVVSVLGLPAVASAQRWGHERFPDAGACFFRDADFRGEYFCVRAGGDVPRVPDDMNDQISSIRMFGPASVVVFRDVRFGGDSTRFGRDVRNLQGAGWNDRLSSLRVEGGVGRGDRLGNLNDENRGRDRDQRATQDVDRIIRRAYQDILGRAPDEGGLRQYRGRMLDDHWNEEQVRNSLRTSPEFAAVRRTRAEDVVRRAYRNMLKRDPDAGGAEAYIQHVLNDNWSQQDVEKDLRRSPEYRGR